MLLTLVPGTGNGASNIVGIILISFIKSIAPILAILYSAMQPASTTFNKASAPADSASSTDKPPVLIDFKDAKAPVKIDLYGSE